MFERFLRRAEKVARRRAEARVDGLAERLRETLPGGIVAQVVDEGVRLSGRNLLNRIETEHGLRWLVLRCVRDEGRKRL